MEYLREVLEKSPDINELDEYVEKYSSIVDEIIQDKNKTKKERIKCNWEKLKINKNLSIYKSTINTINKNNAQISIYIPSRKNSYTLYFSYNTWEFIWNHTDKDEWTWFRVSWLILDFEKVEIFNKKTKNWEHININNELKSELYNITKVLYKELFNNYLYNKNIII